MTSSRQVRSNKYTSQLYNSPLSQYVWCAIKVMDTNVLIKIIAFKEKLTRWLHDERKDVLQDVFVAGMSVMLCVFIVLHACRYFAFLISVQTQFLRDARFICSPYNRSFLTNNSTHRHTNGVPQSTGKSAPPRHNQRCSHKSGRIS